MSNDVERQCRCSRIRGWLRDVSPSRVNRSLCCSDDCQTLGHLALLAVLLVAAFGCRGHDSDRAHGARAKASASSGLGSAPAASAAVGAAALDVQERYRAALARGLDATSKGDYDAAEVAFGEALLAKPKDERVLGARGHARLLAGRDADAKHDLERAKSLDDVQAAEVWLDLGILAERRKAELEARVDFTRSRDRHSTPAALAKLAGKMQCPGDISRAAESDLVPEGPTPEVLEFPTWQAAWSALEPGGTSATEAEAKANFDLEKCASGYTGKTNPTPSSGSEYPAWHFLLSVPSRGVAVLRDVDSGSYLRCGGGPHVTAHVDHDVLWISSERVEAMTGEPACEGCIPACHGGAWHRFDYFTDARSLRFLMVIRQAEDSEPTHQIKMTIEKGAVVLDGNGCNWSIPIRAQEG